jgi:signal transduction histidine kinase
MTGPSSDVRIEKYIQVIRALPAGKYDLSVNNQPEDEIGRLGKELKKLSDDLKSRFAEQQKFNLITLQINSGLLLDEILGTIYREFRDLVPFNRIGFSLIEDKGKKVRALWEKSDQPIIKLQKDFVADLHGSSLEKIIATRRPRILNNLVEYLKEKPNSESTRLIVEEGMHSSLTCPLIANGIPVGFIFFSSIHPGIYEKHHVETFQRIAEQLSVIVEKGRLVSELSEQKNKIEEQNKELKRLDELKNTFLGIAAHDLRNPLANIQMISNLLASDAAPLSVNESLELVSEIYHNTENMLNLLNDILDVTHIESGKLSLNPILIQTSEFLEGVVARHNLLAESKNTHIILEKIPTGRIFADPLRLRQVLDNLLSNAVKYSPPNSTVNVHVIREPEAWRIEIKDQGSGITQKDRQQLFTDFAKLSAKPTGGEQSTGLGLAIVKRVVEAHKGKIGVESNPGKGSTFWFSLPDMTEN